MLTVEEIHVFACIDDEGATIRSFETHSEAAAFAEGFNSAAAQAEILQAEKPEIDHPRTRNPQKSSPRKRFATP